MGAVWFRAAVEIRRSWRGSVVLVVLTGVGGGLAFATFAGARRADSALDRFVAGTGQQFDATIDLGPGEDTRPIARLPYVTRGHDDDRVLATAGREVIEARAR